MQAGMGAGPGARLPTLPPVWSEIEQFRRRRGRVSLTELGEITARAHQVHLQELRRLRELHARLDWPRVPRPEILLYTPSQLRQLIRLGDTDAAAGSQATAGPWRPGPLGAPWHLPDNDQSFSILNHTYDTYGMTQTQTQSSGAQGGRASEWWSWRGLGAGTVLLVTALMLVRATDRCFTRNYARSRRRRSVEWPTPNVLATSQQNPPDLEPGYIHAEFESSDSGDFVYTTDLPPPYSEVAADANKHGEDPPPPYSACYVAYSNPKNGTPSVTFLKRQRQKIYDAAATSSRHTLGNLPVIAHSSNGFNIVRRDLISDVVLKIPYADTSAETDSDDCNGECISHSLEQINIGPVPIATEDMTIEVTPIDDTYDDDASYITVVEEPDYNNL